MPFIDSHSHLNFPQFAGDLPAVLAHAKTSGVAGMVNVGTDLATSRESIALAEQQPYIFATVGIHPHDATSLAADLAALTTLASHPRVLAIGEIGLDYFRDLAPRDIQKSAFIAQLELALTVKKPIVLHCREAYSDMLEILQAHYLGKLEGRAPGILHSFAGSAQDAADFIAAGFLLGVNNLATYPQNESIREALKDISLTKIVLETDCPFLPPQTLRGKRCEPAHIIPVAEMIAAIHSVSVVEVGLATTANLENLLNTSWS